MIKRSTAVLVLMICASCASQLPHEKGHTSLRSSDIRIEMGRVLIRGVALTNAPVSDATSLLCKAAMVICTNKPSANAPIAPFVDPVDYLTVIGAECHNPFEPVPSVKDKTVSLSRDCISYLNLLEEICRQTDRYWRITGSGIVLEYSNRRVEPSAGDVATRTAPEK